MSLGLWSQSKMWFGSLICCRAWSIWKTSWSTCLGFFLWNRQSGTPNSILHNYRMFSQILGGRRPPVEWWRQGMSATQKLEKDCGKQLVDWRSRFLRFLQALLRDTDAIYLFFPSAKCRYSCRFMMTPWDKNDEELQKLQKHNEKRFPRRSTCKKWKKCIEIGQCQSYSLIQEIHRATWLELLRSFEIWVCWVSQMSPVKEKQRQPRPGQHRSTMSSVSMTSVSFRDAKTQKNATHILSSAGHCAKNDWQIYANIRSQLHSGMWDSEPKTNWWAGACNVHFLSALEETGLLLWKAQVFSSVFCKILR